MSLIDYINIVTINGLDLQDIPEIFITEEICKIAVNYYDGTSLKFVPEILRTHELRTLSETLEDDTTDDEIDYY